MPKLGDLCGGLSSMSDDELREFIRTVRTDRARTKPNAKKRKTTAQVRSKLDSLLASMTPEEVKEILGGDS